MSAVPDVFGGALQALIARGLPRAGSPRLEQWGVAGTYTYVAPVSGWYKIEAIGSGGGSAGGTTGVRAPGAASGGSRGAGWQYLAAGTSVTVTVGAGGVAGTAASDGGNGNASSFGAYISAPGGIKSTAASVTGAVAPAAPTFASTVVNQESMTGGAGGNGLAGAGNTVAAGGGAPGSRFGNGGTGGTGTINGAGSGAGCNGNGTGNNTGGSSGGFPNSNGSASTSKNSTMPTLAMLIPGVSATTTDISGVGLSELWSLMAIGSGDNFYGGAGSGTSGQAGGIFGGASGPGTGGLSAGAAGGFLGGGSGAVGPNAGGAGGNGGGAGSGASGAAAQGAGAKGGDGYVGVKLMEAA